MSNRLPTSGHLPATPTGYRPTSSRARQLDDDLDAAVRRSSYIRQGFYVVVLLVALAGQVSGAVEALDLNLLAAVPAVAALELGGIVVLNNADVRRRLGERAIGSRLLSAAIAVWAVAFNWLAHADHLLGGFFAGMSALGYLVWLTHTENQRRDRLRATGDLPPTTPAYEVVGHWLLHPWLTRRARSLAKANPALGLFESLDAASAQIRRGRRDHNIARVLRRKMRATVDKTTADIAVAVYDLDEIAGRLAAQADYDKLTGLLAADLDPDRLAGGTSAADGGEVADVAVPAIESSSGSATEEATGEGHVDATETPTTAEVPAITDNVVAFSGAATRRRNRRGRDGRLAEVTVEEMAAKLTEVVGKERVGAPTARDILVEAYGKCSTERARAAKDMHNARLGHESAPADADAEDVLAVLA
jgi:hypothetical protein